MKRLLLLFMLISNSAFAAEATVQGGWLHTGNSNYGDSAGFVGRLEQPVYNGLNLGAELGYHGKQSHDPYGSISGTHLLGEAIYYPPVDWKLKPYILVGWGWSWWSWDRSQDMIDKGIIIEVGDSFAQKYAVGFDYSLGRNWSINMEWNYFESHVPKDSFYEKDGSFSNVVGDDNRSGRVRIGQEETGLMVGLKYEF